MSAAPHVAGTAEHGDVPGVSYDPIPVVEAPSERVFEREYVRRRRPVIIKNAFDHWPAMKRWSLAHLRQSFGDISVLGIALRDGRIDVGEDRDAVFARVNLGEHIDAIARAGNVRHYASVPLNNMPATFREEIGVPAYCEHATWLRPRFWLGRAGTVTPLHRDLPHNLSAQVFGRKRWLLYPPAQNELVYPCRPWSRAPNFARVDPEAPDLARFPRFARARPLGCVLGPGEMLFIPNLHWHHVRSLDDNAAANYWFGGSVIAALGRMSLAFKKARSLFRGEWDAT